MWRWIVGIVIVGLVAGGIWWQVTQGVEIEAALVGHGEVEAVVEELGKTRIDRTREVAMPIDGRVLPIELEEGDAVRAGEVVAQLETTELESRVAEARARVAKLDADIARTIDERLERSMIDQIEQLIVSLDQTVQAAEEQTRATSAQLDLAVAVREDLEEAGAQQAATDLELKRAQVTEVESEVEVKKSFLTLRSAQAVRAAILIGARFVEQMIELKSLDRTVIEREREAAEAVLARLVDDLSRATVRAPIDGVVLSRHEDSERVLSAGTVLLEIGSLDDLYVEIEMLTDEAGRVEVGDAVDVEWAGASLAGAVSRIEPRGFTKVSSLGVEQQRVIVKVGLESVPAGMGSAYRVRTRVVTDAATGLRVARSAVFRDRDAWRAFVVRGGRARRVVVEIGLMNESWVEVLGGLEEGDVVIAAPGLEVKNGGRVRVVGPVSSGE